MTHDRTPDRRPDDGWILLDQPTVAQLTLVLERLAGWLHASEGDDDPRATDCANVLSAGETDDALEIACWIDMLNGRLQDLIDLETPQP